LSGAASALQGVLDKAGEAMAKPPEPVGDPKKDTDLSDKEKLRRKKERDKNAKKAKDASEEAARKAAENPKSSGTLDGHQGLDKAIEDAVKAAEDQAEALAEQTVPSNPHEGEAGNTGKDSSWMLDNDEQSCVCDCAADAKTGAMSPPPMHGTALISIDEGSTALLLGGLCIEGDRPIASGGTGSGHVFTAGTWVMKLGQGIGPDEVAGVASAAQSSIDKDSSK